MNTNTNKNTNGAEPHRVQKLTEGLIGVNFRLKGDRAEFIDFTSLLDHLHFFAFNLCNFLYYKNLNNTESVDYVLGCIDPPPVQRTLYGHVLCTYVDNISTYCTSCLSARIEP